MYFITLQLTSNICAYNGLILREKDNISINVEGMVAEKKQKQVDLSTRFFNTEVKNEKI